MPKQVAVYVRVSSKSQDTKSQEPDLTRWAAAQSEPAIWYRDKFTGKSMDRPGWNRLHRAIVAGEVSTVAIWRLDRLGRTAKGLTALFEELRQLGVGLVSLRDGLDLATPSGRLMANVLASVAQFETEVRAERILAGQSVARANGKRWGGSKPGRRISVTREQQAIVAQLHAANATVAAMARATGLSRPTIYTLLPGSAVAP